MIKTISKEEFNNINDGVYFEGNEFNVVISCRYIQTWEQMAEVLGNAFQFPMRNENMYATWDWLTDLSWLGAKDKIRIYFYEEQELYKLDMSFKEQFFNWLKDLIEFWKNDVKNAYINGKPGEQKIFEIFLVN